VTSGELIASTEPKSQLAADASAGTLLIDGATSQATASTKRPETETCEQDGSGTHLRPLGANDVRAQSSRDPC
jgi:hypothetical protein